MLHLNLQNHRFTYNESMPVESCVQSICDLALRFGEDDEEGAEGGSMVFLFPISQWCKARAITSVFCRLHWHSCKQSHTSTDYGLTCLLVVKFCLPFLADGALLWVIWNEKIRHNEFTCKADISKPDHRNYFLSNSDLPGGFKAQKAKREI